MSQKTAHQIIDETVEYYSTHPRSVGQLAENVTKCLYKGSNNKECAFQRVVENDLSSFDTSSIPNSASDVMKSLKDGIKFKEGYEGHSPDFWNNIQELHDKAFYWNTNTYPATLTEEGVSFIDYIKDIFN